MKKKAGMLIIRGACPLLLLLSGCKRMVDWTAQNFNQAQTIEIPLKRVKPYLRTAAVHHQLSTCAIFDALWISDVVRYAYAEVAMVRTGKTNEQYQTFLRRQLEENKHYITFYLLSEYNVPVGDTADWQVLLRVAGHVYQPCELKTVELTPEYRAFFAKRFSKLKVAYLVKFVAQDMDEQPLIVPTTSTIELCLNSTQKQVVFEWQVKAEDFHTWGHI